MRYGVALPTGGECGDPRFLVALSELAEASGWEGVFLEDYVCYQGDPRRPTCNSWIALAAIAVRTRAVRLGVEVAALTRRRPWNLAREAAGIDQLSGGRMILGVGIGDTGDPGFGRFGEPTDARTRRERLEEGLDIVAGLWTGEPFSFSGKHFTVRDVAFLPRPVQQPRPPIWIGGGWPNERALERALRWGGCCFYRRAGGHLARDDVAELRTVAAGRPLEISVGGQARREDVDEEREQIHAVAQAGADWWVEWVPPGDREEMRRAVAAGPLRVG